VNHAHWDAGTPSSVLQWSAAATSVEGRSSSVTVATAEPELPEATQRRY